MVAVRSLGAVALAVAISRAVFGAELPEFR